jgi:hypothetical protein
MKKMLLVLLVSVTVAFAQAQTVFIASNNKAANGIRLFLVTQRTRLRVSLSHPSVATQARHNSLPAMVPCATDRPFQEGL